MAGRPCGHCGGDAEQAQVGADVPDRVTGPDHLGGEPQQCRVHASHAGGGDNGARPRSRHRFGRPRRARATAPGRRRGGYPVQAWIAAARPSVLSFPHTVLLVAWDVVDDVEQNNIADRSHKGRCCAGVLYLSAGPTTPPTGPCGHSKPTSGPGSTTGTKTPDHSSGPNSGRGSRIPRTTSATNFRRRILGNRLRNASRYYLCVIKR